MANLSEKTSREFTRLLGSKAPAPGGGGASALLGAMASSLGSMVGIYTLGKKKYRPVEGEIQELLDKAEKLRLRFLELIDEDAENFEPLSRAYGLSKKDPNRDQIMEKCLRKAAESPLEIFELSCQTIEILRAFEEKGSRIMLSDAATGAAFARGALLGAAVNVKVNTHLMKDRDYAEKIEVQIDEDLEKYKNMAEEIFLSVWRKY